MYYTIRICAVQSVFAKQSLVSVAFHVTAEAKPRRSRPLINSKLRHQLNHTWKTTVLGKKIRSASGFLICDRGIRYWCPDLKCFFYRRFCHSILELSFRSGTVLLFTFFLYFFGACQFLFLFLSALSHIACFFFFSIMFYAPLKNKQKKKPPRKAVLFHEYQASTGRSNKFVSLLAASVCFFYDHCIRVCVFACASFYYRPPVLRKRILVLLKTSRSITRSVRLCIS